MDEVPIAKSSDTNGSAPMGHPEQYPRARGESDERTPDELKAIRDQSWDMWNTNAS